jgi:hypothetical protein
MGDVTGAEFETLMGVLSKLTYVSTPEGSRDICSLISNQADLTSDFKVVTEFTNGTHIALHYGFLCIHQSTKCVVIYCCCDPLPTSHIHSLNGPGESRIEYINSTKPLPYTDLPRIRIEQT